MKLTSSYDRFPGWLRVCGFLSISCWYFSCDYLPGWLKMWGERRFDQMHFAFRQILFAFRQMHLQSEQIHFETASRADWRCVAWGGAVVRREDHSAADSGRQAKANQSKGMETIRIRNEDQDQDQKSGSGKRIRIKIRIKIRNEDQEWGSRMRIRNQDQKSGLRRPTLYHSKASIS